MKGYINIINYLSCYKAKRFVMNPANQDQFHIVFNFCCSRFFFHSYLKITNIGINYLIVSIIIKPHSCFHAKVDYRTIINLLEYFQLFESN